MANVIISTKIGIALDVDGTLADTNWECYQRVKEAWEEHYKAGFPLDYGTFGFFRRHVADAGQYFSFSKMVQENNGVLPQNAKELDKEYLNHPDIPVLKQLFYDFRKAKIQDDKLGWLSESKLYDGVKDMVTDLGKTGWNVFVVTSKNAEAVKEILQHNGIEQMDIYDKSFGARINQFGQAASNRNIEIPNIIPYDDLLPQLLAARSLGMTPIAAAQGYGDNKEIKENGFELALPDQFIEAVETNLKRRSG